ncbi:MAG: ABC transporter permease [Clostridiales Family XIII bacterium]|jgi:ribose transport system permease protein|nr:ABC transporter permease [Clostridiales Family XIII bacterium]
MEQRLQAPSFSTKRFLTNNSAYLILIGLIVVSSILSPVFFSLQNIMNIFRQQSPAMLLALGAMLVIITAGIDLSSGAMLAISNVFVAYFITNLSFYTPSGVFLSIVMGIVIGTAFGCLNGVIVTYLKMPSFIVTLATATIVRGIAYVITFGSTIRLPVDPVKHEGSYDFFHFGQSGDPLLGVPYSAWIVIGIVIFFWFLMKYSAYGRILVATGSNNDAARLAGINVKKYVFSAYAIGGLLAGIAGALMTARAGIATPSMGSGFELNAIAAVVIGGASLAGGKGKVGNTVVGVFIIALIGNIMTLMNVPPYPQQIIQGLVIIIAVLLNAGKDK